MVKLVGGVLLVLFAVLLAPAFASDAVVTADLTVRQLQPVDAIVVLRSLVGTRQLQTVDEHTVRVTDTAETVELAKVVLDVAEHPSEVAADVPTRELADGTVLACVRLRHATVSDVMVALRRKVAIARVAMSSELSSVTMRDTPAHVASALDVVRRMETPEK